MKILAIFILAIMSFQIGKTQSWEDKLKDRIKYDTVTAKNTGERFSIRTSRDRNGLIRAVSYKNLRDVYADTNYYYLDGRVYDKDPDEVEPSGVNFESMRNAIRTSFTTAEIQKLTNVRGRIILLPTISNTGKVLGVYCRVEFDTFVDIPIERIATLQKKIKALRGTVTDPVAKQLKYTSSFNMIFFKNL